MLALACLLTLLGGSRMRPLATIEDPRVIRQGVSSYAHPIFRAPFTLVGDGGGGERRRGAAGPPRYSLSQTFMKVLLS